MKGKLKKIVGILSIALVIISYGLYLKGYKDFIGITLLVLGFLLFNIIKEKQIKS